MGKYDHEQEVSRRWKGLTADEIIADMEIIVKGIVSAAPAGGLPWNGTIARDYLSFLVGRTVTDAEWESLTERSPVSGEELLAWVASNQHPELDLP